MLLINKRLLISFDVDLYRSICPKFNIKFVATRISGLMVVIIEMTAARLGLDLIFKCVLF